MSSTAWKSSRILGLGVVWFESDFQRVLGKELGWTPNYSPGASEVKDTCVVMRRH